MEPTCQPAAEPPLGPHVSEHITTTASFFPLNTEALVQLEFSHLLCIPRTVLLDMSTRMSFPGSSEAGGHAPGAVPVSRHCRRARPLPVGQRDKLGVTVSGREHGVPCFPETVPRAERRGAGKTEVVDPDQATRGDGQAEGVNQD